MLRILYIALFCCYVCFTSIANAANPASFVSPTPSGTIASSQFTLKWQEVTAYSGELKIIVKLEETVNENVNLISVSGEQITLTRGAGTYTYRLKVTRIYDGSHVDTVGYDDSVTFTIAVATPSQPSFNSIPTTVYNDNYTISWTADSDPSVTYQLQEKVGASGNWVTKQNSGATQKTFSNGDGTYYYQVRACKSGDCSDFRRSGAVNVVSKPTQKPVMTSAVNQYTDSNTGQVVVTWNPVAGAPVHKIKRESGNWEAKSSSKSFTEEVGSSTTYYVKACATLDEASCSSNVASQTINLNYASSVSISSPTGNYSRGSFTLNFSSSSVQHYYKVWDQTGLIDGNSGSQKTFSKNDGSYSYFIKACLPIDGGSDPCSNNSQSFGVTVLNAPSSQPTPTAPTVSQNGSVAVSWSPATGSSLSYTVYKRLGTSNWQGVSKGSSLGHTFTGLGDGKYQFKVKACNTLNGDTQCTESGISSETVVVNKPNTPGNFVSVPSPDEDGEFTVSWGSESSGHAENYELEQSKNDAGYVLIQNNSLTSKDINVGEGLYRYRVRAVNEDFAKVSYSGYRYSDYIEVEAETPPNAPVMQPSKTIESDELNVVVNVAWTAAGSFPHRIKNDYSYQNENSTTGWEQTDTNSSHQMLLSVGVNKLTVQACLDINVSSSCGPSDTQTITIEYTEPTTVMELIAPEFSRGTYRIEWTPDRPYIYVNEDSQPVNYNPTSSTRHIDVTKNIDKTYLYDVQGCLESKDLNPLSCTPVSNSRTVTVVNLPSNLAAATSPATTTNGSLEISWTQPTGKVDKYKVFKRLVGDTDWGTEVDKAFSLSHTYNDLPDGSYQFKYQACNYLKPSDIATLECVDSPVSVASIAARKPDAPGAFLPISSPNETGSFRVQWGAESSGYSDEYRLYQAVNGGDWGGDIHDKTLTTYKDVSSLTSGVYTYKVEACNTVSNFTTCSDAVLSNAVTVANSTTTIEGPTESRGDFTLSWSPSRPYSIITENDIEIEGKYTFDSIPFADKSNGEYRYTVQGCLDIELTNCATPSPEYTVTVLKTPETPAFDGLAATIDSSTLAVSWVQPATENADVYKLYSRLVGDQWGGPIVASLVYTHTILDLVEGTYQLKLEACNSLLTLTPAEQCAETIATVQVTPSEVPTVIEGSEEDDTLVGTDLNDHILGLAGNDDITGGPGDDLLEDSAGNDIYRFNLGDGHDIIDDQGTGSDKLIFGPGISPLSIQMEAEPKGGDLLIIVSETDSVTIKDWHVGGYTGVRVESYEFADGSVHGRTTFNKLNGPILTVVGTNEGDSWSFPVSSKMALSHRGGKGNDTIGGGGWDEYYYYQLGDGSDIIEDGVGHNFLYFEDINRDEVKFVRVSNNLVYVIGQETITVVDWFVNSFNKVYNTYFADQTLRTYHVEAQLSDLPPVTIDYTGSENEEGVSSSTNFIASATPYFGNESIIQGVRFSIDGGTTWQIASLLEGVYQFDFGLLSVGNYELMVEITLTDDTVSQQSIAFEVGAGDIPWADTTETTVANSPSQPVNIPSNQSVGSMAGQASVSGAQASYTIPIALPPGRNGMQPSVSLNYSSSGGNGIAGMGWSISASSAISRCAKSVAQDGFFQNPQFELDDALCFNGSRMVLTSGVAGQSGSEYRTEIDQFALITIEGGDLNSVGSYFKVKYKNGQTAEYGSSDNTAEVVLQGHTITKSWLLNIVSDVSQNHFIHYNYSEFGAAEVLLSSIQYTGNSRSSAGNRSVHFNYATDRSDSRSGYVYGGYWESTAVLDDVVTKVGNATVFTYDLDYRYSSATNRTLLSSVQQCDSANSCLTPTEFEWQDAPFSYEFERLQVNGEDVLTDKGYLAEAMPYGDINGDGARDWPGYFIDADKQGATHSFELEHCYRNSIRLQRQCISGDFNNDGLTDGWEITASGYLQLNITEHNSNGIDSNAIVTNIVMGEAPIDSAIKADHIANIADYNGDGFVDLVVYRFAYDGVNSERVELTLYTHTGDLSAPYDQASSSLLHTMSVAGVAPNRRVELAVSYMGDIDGNGLPDLIQLESRNQNSPHTAPVPTPVNMLLNYNGVLTSRAFSFTVNTSANDTFFFSQFIDVNGDGLVDWLGYTNADTPQKQLAINLGGGDFAPAVDIDMDFAMRTYRDYDSSSGDYQTRRYPKFNAAMKVHDINMDGIPELLVPGDILLESCALVSETGPAGNSSSIKCGHDLYTAVKLDPNSNATSPLQTEEFDDSIYQYNAYTFSQNDYGDYVATLLPTDIVGNAYESTMVDAYGDGFVDMISVVAVRSGLGDCPAEGSDAYLKHSTATGSAAGINCDYGVYVNRSKGSAEGNEEYAATDMLVGVTNGLGATANWDYKPLSSSAHLGANDLPLYAVDERDVNDADHYHFASSMYVVREFENSNGVGGINQTRYAYRGAMYNNKGRGFRGFRSIVSENQRDGLVTQVDFRQKFPFSNTVQGVFVFEDSLYGGVIDYDYASTLQGNSSTIGQAVSATVTNWGLNEAHRIGNGTPICNSVWNSEYAENDLVCGPGLNVYSVYQQSNTVLTRDLISHAILHTTTSTIDDIDAYGNVLESTQTIIDEYATQQTKSASIITNDENSWWLGRLDESTKTYKKVMRTSSDILKAVAEQVDKDHSTTTTYTDFNAFRKPETVTTTASDSARTLEVATDYNTQGQVESTSSTGQVLNDAGVWVNQTRSSVITYTADGYFPLTVTNALGHTVVTQTHSAFGKPSSVTDANGLTISTEYDGFGRELTVDAPGQPRVYFAYQQPDFDAPSYSAWQRVTVQMGTPGKTEYFDTLNRPLRSAVVSFDGSSEYFTDIEYNSRGLKSFETMPYQKGNSRYGTRYQGYDALRRLTQKVSDQVDSTLSTTYVYEGLETKINAGNLPQMSRSYNSLEQLIETQDSNGNLTRYAYNSMGSPIVIRDAKGNDIIASYNAVGHKLYVDDPNMGRTDFINNSFGEIENEQDANNDSIDYTYDLLGRVTRRFTQHSGAANDSTATFLWDNALENCKRGLLCRESENAMQRTYHYDSLSRVSQTITTLDGVDFTTTPQYDSQFGRSKGLTYPNGLTLAYEYNSQGYMTSISNAASDYQYQEITAMDAFGNITQANLTNGQLTGDYLFSPSTGQMHTSRVEGDVTLHDLSYSDYDQYGNIKQQANLITNTEENFDYDNLQRLTNNTVSFSGQPVQDIHYGYDELGNFKYKSDYSVQSETAYQYGENGAGPNAVSSVVTPNGQVNFGYDNKGNMTSGDNLSAAYTAYGKPYSLTRNGVSSTFEYGSDRLRYKQVKASDTIYYIDKMFEIDNQGWRAYIGDVAVIKHTKAVPEQSIVEDTTIRFLHRDRLGSAETLTDHNGQVTERRRYDPFGKPRGSSGESFISPILASFGTDVSITNRGFTDHEHLDDQELIHMNGRVYDYNLGRFMSVDPFIQAPGNSQSINPYSYVMNNPLGGVDPTGYISGTPMCAGAPNLLGCNGQGGMPGSHSAPSSTGVLERNEQGRKVKYSVTEDEHGVKHIHLSGGSEKNQKAIMNALTGDGDGATLTESQVVLSAMFGGTNQSGGTPSGGGSLQDQIKSDAHNSIVRAGEEMGVDMGQGSYVDYGSVDAKWGNITRDGDGNITKATVSCSRACQMDAANQGRITSNDIARAAMVMNFRHGQSQAANILFAEAGIVFVGIKAAQLVGNGLVAWSSLSASEKIAYYGLLGETFTVANGTAPSALGASFSLGGAAGFVVTRSPFILPRMLIRSPIKKAVKVRNGKRVIEKANQKE